MREFEVRLVFRGEYSVLAMKVPFSKRTREMSI